MFATIYELFVGENLDPAYSQDVFPSVGLLTVVFSFAFALVFYVALGRWKPIWHKLSHWVISIIALLILCVFFALTQAKGTTGASAYDAYMFKFSLINGVIAFIYFLLFSLLLKKTSIFAKRTPF